jgi:hypothetical protein
MQSDWMRISVSAVAIAAGASVAMADLSPVVFRIEANNAQGETGAWQVALNPDNWTGGTYSYALPDDIHIVSDQGREVAVLTDVTLSYVQDPQINMFFAVQAAGASTTFTITSGLLSFPGVNPASGRATASVTVTDGDNNGASLSGVSGGAMYLANYNGVVPGGTNFASLLSSPLTVGPSEGDSVTESTPMSPGFDPIAGTVSDMSSRFSFTLSANDVASGTSTWVVVPSPGAAGMLLLAGAFGLGRRRR